MTKEAAKDGMQPISELTAAVAAKASEPGANKASIRQYLAEQQGLAVQDAAALTDAICRRLLEERFPAISEMELMLTEQCNQRCDYCFVEGKNAQHRMPWAVAKRAVDFLFEYSRDAEAVKVLFFGGEPLLEFDLIARIAGYAEERATGSGKRVDFNMTTNATLMTPERAAFLGEHNVKFLISMDGDKQTHDRHRRMVGGASSYDAIVRNLPAMRSAQPWLGARVTVHPDTVPRLYENVLHLAGLGFRHFLIGPATGLDWTDEALDTYKEQMLRIVRWLKARLEAGEPYRVAALEETLETLHGRRHVFGCRAGRHSVCVTSKGEIFACSKMLGVDDLAGIYPLGNLEEGITEIYNRLFLCGLIPLKREKCEACRFVDGCMGGCYATNYQATGCIHEPAPFECRLKERTFEITALADRLVAPLQAKKPPRGLRPPGTPT